jgi:oxygen-independent coproporphyrinogen-3 oxidase
MKQALPQAASWLAQPEHRLKAFFEFITDKIAQTDLSGYLTQYPPLFTWRPAKKAKSIPAWGVPPDNDRLGIYVHIPFCEYKCAYCRYFSKDSESAETVDNYLQALFKEMRLYAPFFKGRRIHTLYVGGGTPSVLSMPQLEKLFEGLEKNFDLRTTVQRCVEVNPASINAKKLRILQKHRVNRLTIGVQSLSNRALRLANRDQSPEEALDCLRKAKQLGFETVNIDLMAGLPGESVKSFLNGLQKILSLGPDMIHIHPFFPTRHTRFIEQGDSLDREMIKSRDKMCQAGAQEVLAHGYREISFDALGRKEQDRNVQLADAIEVASSFLGLGVCAVSHIKGRLRYINREDIGAYIEDLRHGFLPVKASMPLDKKTEMIYYIVATLRYGALNKGEFEDLFGEKIGVRFKNILEHLRGIGRLRETATHLILNSTSVEEYAVYSKYFYDQALLAPFWDEFDAWRRKKNPIYV